MLTVADGCGACSGERSSTLSREHDEIMEAVDVIVTPNNVSDAWVSWTLGDHARVEVVSVVSPSGTVVVPVGSHVQFTLGAASPLAGSSRGFWTSDNVAVVAVETCVPCCAPLAACELRVCCFCQLCGCMWRFLLQDNRQRCGGTTWHHHDPLPSILSG